MNKYAQFSKAPKNPGAQHSITHGCKNKRRYVTEEYAERVADRSARQLKRPMRAYQCAICEGWHITKRRTFT